MKQHDRHRMARGSGRSWRTLRAWAAVFLSLVTLMTALSVAAPVAAQDQPAAGTSSVEVHVSTCEPGYAGDTIFDDCHGEGVTDVQVQLVSADSTLDQSKVTEQPTTPGPGLVQFGNIPGGTYTINLNLPEQDDTSVVTYCSLADSDTVVPMTPGNTQQGEITVEDGQAVICDFYIIPTEAPDDQAKVTINPVICPAGTEAPNGFDDLDGVCTEPVEDVTFTWGNAGGTIEEINTDDADPVVIDGIEPGTYTLYSGVPLEFAREALFCVADEGDRYQKEFNDNGVTIFSDIQREQIVCDWFIMPYDLQGGQTPTATATSAGPNQDPVVTPTPDPTQNEPTATATEDVRGVESGASLTVHLSLCPVDYDGNTLYDTCHDVGISDLPFYLTGPNVEQQQDTTVPQSPGPGIVEFTQLPAGDYTLSGGPPGDFGGVELYCTTQPDGAVVETSLQSTQASFTIGEGEHILCDWYYIPTSQGGIQTPTPTVTPEPEERAEILVTLYTCEPDTNVAGASYGDLQDACGETRDGVAFSLGDPGAPPLTADTGASGDGAVRFYELLPGDYTMTPSLPDDLTSVAVFCQLDGGDTYQKTLSDGATTFVNVDGDSVTCDWFAKEASQQPEPDGPSGSITVREYLCGADASEISDFEQECEAGSSGVTFTLGSTDGAITLSSATNTEGVAVFTELPDGFYTLEQSEGMWCKARAERVDSQSRVIVDGGQNTDVFLYQCADVTELPSTGTGPGISPMNDAGDTWWEALSPVRIAFMGVGVLGAALLVWWSMNRRRFAA